jgi:NAD-dependent SIR2 family protein deacetylase
MEWKYFAELRNLALKARPTQAHINLAELAWKKRGLMCLTEDIDGQSPMSPFSSLDILWLYVLLWELGH